MSNIQFSAIVPTHERPKRLARCLSAFRQLDFPAGAWELIVVNDGGSDSFANITADLAESLPLRLIDNDRAGPAAARNAGARIARGRFLAFTDDDCCVAPDWLSCFHRDFASEDVAALGGRGIIPTLDNLGARASQHLTDFLHEYMRDRKGNSLLLFSNNAAYRRQVFEAIQGFDEGFPLAGGEDMELSFRLIAAGYRQRLCPRATVWHFTHLTAWGHLIQQFRYGRGGYYFQQALRRLPGARHIEVQSPAPFYTALWRSLQTRHEPYPVSLLVGLGQLAYQVGLCYQSMLSLQETARESKFSMT